MFVSKYRKTFKFLQSQFFSQIIKLTNTKLVQSKIIQKKKFYIPWGLLGFMTLAKKPYSNVQNDRHEVEQLNKILEKVDMLFQQGHFEESYELLMNCKEQNVDVLWRLGRVMFNLSREVKYDQEYRRSLTMQAYEIMSQLILKYHDNFEVHKWYAVVLDAKSAYIGIKERIKQLKNVRKHMDLAVTLNPNDATTLHMLGEWCYQVSELPWYQRKIAEALFTTTLRSTYEDALEYFLRAEIVEPRFYSINLLRLGACYLKLNKEDQAKYYLTLAASYPAKSDDDHLANKEAAKLLKRLK